LSLLVRPALALDVSGSLLLRSAYGLVLEDDLFTETIATAEVSHRFEELEGLSLKLRIDPSFQFDTGRTRFGLLDRSGLDELYVDLASSRLALRVGFQKLAWGRGDGIVPNDVLNAKDLRRFLADSELERKIASFMVRGSRFGPSGTLELVWIPRFEPDRYPEPGDPFFPPTLTLRPAVEVLGFPIPAEVVLLEEELPKRDFKHSELGIRGAATFGPLDGQLYMFFGYDRQPIYTPEVHFFLDGLPASLALIDLLDAEVRIDVTPRHPPIWQIGMDFTSTVGPVVLRGEAAFLKGRRFNWADTDSLPSEQLAGLLGGPDTRRIFHDGLLEIILPPLVSENDSATFLLGVDYTPPALGEWELFSSAQLVQQRIFDVGPPLIFEERETSLTGLIRASRGGGTLELEAAGNVNVDRKAYLVSASGSYRIDDSWKLRGRFFSIGGERGSLLGDFQALDLGVLELVYYW
jgi:hypothetical protein